MQRGVTRHRNAATEDRQKHSAEKGMKKHVSLLHGDGPLLCFHLHSTVEFTEYLSEIRTKDDEFTFTCHKKSNDALQLI